MVVDVLAYHPSVAHYQRYAATTIGRDKALRTLQYTSKFLSWYLYRTDAPTTTISPFDTTKSRLALARKLFHVGKWLDHLRYAAQAADSTKPMDPFLRYATVGRQLGYAAYIFLDNLTVPHAVGIRPGAASKKTAEKFEEAARRAWVVGLLFSVFASGYSLWKLKRREEEVEKRSMAASSSISGPGSASSSVSGINEKVAGSVSTGTSGNGTWHGAVAAEDAVEGRKIEKERMLVSTQLLSDLCDIVIPTTALGWASFDDGIVGMAGATSSIIGVLGQWRKTA